MRLTKENLEYRREERAGYKQWLKDHNIVENIPKPRFKVDQRVILQGAHGKFPAVVIRVNARSITVMDARGRKFRAAHDSPLVSATRGKAPAKRKPETKRKPSSKRATKREVANRLAALGRAAPKAKPNRYGEFGNPYYLALYWRGSTPSGRSIAELHGVRARLSDSALEKIGRQMKREFKGLTYNISSDD